MIALHIALLIFAGCAYPVARNMDAADNLLHSKCSCLTRGRHLLHTLNLGGISA